MWAATRGDNRCTQTLFHYAKDVDSEAIVELRELLPDQKRLRPAELLTMDAYRLTVADIGITSPAVTAFAEAAQQAMYPRKTEKPLPRLFTFPTILRVYGFLLDGLVLSLPNSTMLCFASCRRRPIG